MGYLLILACLLSYYALWRIINFYFPNKNGWIRLCMVISGIGLLFPFSLFFYTPYVLLTNPNAELIYAIQQMAMGFVAITFLMWAFWIAIFMIGWILQGFKK